MSIRKMLDKPTVLFLVLGGFFITNALMAEFIGVKILSLEKLLGFTPVSWELFDQEDLSFNLTAGVLLWPVVFVMTDVINEYYGRRGVKLLSFLAVIMIIYAFIMAFLAIEAPPADFWVTSHIQADWSEARKGEVSAMVGDYDYAFRLVFSQGLWIIFGSLVAFLIGQFVDVWIFQRIKRTTGDRYVWARATGSTLVSQFIDSYVVLVVAFYIGAQWDITLVLAIGTLNYIYKFIMAIVLTPVIYLAHAIIDRYLGEELAEKLKLAASNGN
jgi:hypothetical protein